jgi:hypothetical protein
VLGGLTVSGTGSAAWGGTVQKSTGAGIQLSSTSSPSFTDMLIENNAADGVNGTQVNGLTLAGTTVSGNGTVANVSGENDDSFTTLQAWMFSRLIDIGRVRRRGAPMCVVGSTQAAP